MKKLMIAAAIVCAAVSSQAASFTWGNASYAIDNWAGTAEIDGDLGVPMYKDGTMFLYLGSVAYADGAGFDLSAATFVTLGSYDADQYMYGNMDPSAYSQSGLIDANGGQDYSLILVDGTHSSLDELTDGSYFAIRTGTSSSLYDGDLGDFTAELVDYDPISSGDWQKFSSGSVPEPTSGLLLLLGMAGLALKRKNA